MQLETVYIKNMCCQRCIDAVESELTKIGLKIRSVKLGEASFAKSNKVSLKWIGEVLKKRGFELINSEDEQIVEAIKTALIDLVHHSDIEQKIHLSQFLEEKIARPYRLLNKLFSKYSGLTIEKYTILQRIEKVKELIEEGEHNFSEIAYRVGYKTPQHLSSQFKRITGSSMLDYKKSGKRERKHIDRI